MNYSSPGSRSAGHDRGGDLAAYALGALEPEEAQALEEHLETCPACREELSSFRSITEEQLPLATPRIAAPRGLRRSVMKEVRGEAPPRPGKPRLLSGAPLGAFAGALAVAAIVVVLIVVGGSAGPRVVHARVTLPGASAQVSIGGDQAALTVRHMPQPPAGKIYQVWLERGSAPPIPTNALFGVSENGSASVAVPGSLRGVSAVLVTPEPRGGSSAPTHAPVIEARI